MEPNELVIAGGGLAAARAIKSYREAGGTGRVVLVTREPELPYHRPPLSKRYLRGEITETPRVEDDVFYRDNDVEVMLETSVRSVDTYARAAILSNATRLGYRKLLIATGSTPRRLRVPGAELDRVFTLRTLADSAAIRDAARTAGRAVVVGGGFIGMEAAASLRQLGLEVTLLHRGGALFDRLRSHALSAQLLALYREHDVDVLLREEVVRFGGDSHVEWVEAKSGVCIPADVAIVGVGVAPNTRLLDGSGLARDNGVDVDERFQTIVPGIYAVGDVANFFDPLYRRRRRIEHWSNASYHGAEVGKILAGRPGGYDTVSSFFSEVFGTTIKVFGDTTRFDELHEEGSLDTGFLARYGDGGRLVGAITAGQTEDVEQLIKDLIGARAPMHPLDHEPVAGRSQ